MSILNILVGKIDYIQVFMYSNSLYYITLLHVFTCLYNYIGIVICTAYFVFELTFPHPGLYWIYGNKDDDVPLQGQKHMADRAWRTEHPV
jgi:hypothetical protein